MRAADLPTAASKPGWGTCPAASCTCSRTGVCQCAALISAATNFCFYQYLPTWDSPEGVAMWEALARLQDGKAPPAPGAANSSFKRASLAEPLLFEGDSWQLELSNLTGAIVGLRFKGCTSGKCQGSVSGSGSGSGSSSSSLPWWQWAAAMLHLPSGLFSGAGSREQQLDREVVGSWASFNAPLALPVYSTYSEDDYLDAIFNQASRLLSGYRRAGCLGRHSC